MAKEMGVPNNIGAGKTCLKVLETIKTDRIERNVLNGRGEWI